MSITINSSPILNRVLLDGNNTIISITSTNGADHYFRAKIYVENILFDTQSWSRKTAYLAEKDLKKLYFAYFETVFNSTFTAGIIEITDLIKKIDIVIEERFIEDDSLVTTQNIPTFYFMYNVKPIPFDDTLSIQFLETEPSISLIPATGKISIPIFVNAVSQSVVVVLRDNFNSVLDSVTYPSFTGRKIFTYNFDLSTLTLINNTIFFTITLVVGSTVITKQIRLMTLPDYTPKELAYCNNFGVYQYAYLDGQLTIDDALEVVTYEQKDNSMKIFEINETFNYTINTGSFLSSEKQISRFISNSLDNKIFLNSQWVDMVSSIKKLNIYKERNNNYSELLNFSVKQNSTVINTAVMAQLPDIVLDSASIISGFPYIYFTKNNGYTSSLITLIYSKNGGPDVVNNYPNSSPITFGALTSGSYVFKLKKIGEDYYSNTFNLIVT